MARKNSILDGLKLFNFEESAQRSNVINNAVEPFELILGIESILGMRRITTVGRVISSPSLISKLYSYVAIFSVACYILFCIYPEIETELALYSATGLLNKHLFYILVYLIPYKAHIFKTLLKDSTRTLKLFDTLQDIDDELGITDGHAIYSHLRSNVRVSVIFQIFAYLLLTWSFIKMEVIEAKHFPVIAIMFLTGLEMTMCSELLTNIEIRLRYLTAQICQTFSLQQPVEFSGRQRWLKQIDWVNNAAPNVVTLYKLIDKLLKVHDFINKMFNLQVLLFYVNTFLNLMLSIHLFMRLFQTKEHYPVWYYLAVLIWQQATLVGVYLCVKSDRVCMAFEGLNCALVSLLEDKRQEGNHGAARTLLGFCEVARPRFDVYHLFLVDLSLPFNFVSLLVTYVIVLMQFIM